MKNIIRFGFLCFLTCIFPFSMMGMYKNYQVKKQKINNSLIVDYLEEYIRSDQIDAVKDYISTYKQEITDYFQSILNKEQKDYTPLHQALTKECPHLEMIKYLSAIKPLLFIKENFFNNIPLLFYLRFSKQKDALPIIKILARDDAVLNFTNFQGDTGVHVAARTGKIDALEYILSKRREFLYHKNEEGKLPIDHAIFAGQLKTVKWMLKYDSSLSKVVDDNENTLLQAAVFANDLGITQLLLDHGVDPNLANKKGYTPITCAISQKNYEIIKLLLEKGANFSGDKDKRACLQDVIYKNDYKLINLLLDYNIFEEIFNIPDADTMIGILLSRGYIDILELLLERKVLSPNRSITLIDNERTKTRYPYHVILRIMRTAKIRKSHNQLPCILGLKGLKLLEQYGANFSIRDSEGFNFNDYYNQELNSISLQMLSNFFPKYDTYLKEDIEWIIKVLQQKENSQMDSQHLCYLVKFLIEESKKQKKDIENFIHGLISERAQKCPQAYSPETQVTRAKIINRIFQETDYLSELKIAVQNSQKLTGDQKNILLSYF